MSSLEFMIQFYHFNINIILQLINVINLQFSFIYYSKYLPNRIFYKYQKYLKIKILFELRKKCHNNLFNNKHFVLLCVPILKSKNILKS